MPEGLIYLNGAWVERSAAKVSAFDQGFLFGDGVYEVIRVYQGKPFYLNEHLGRLWTSAKAIGIPRDQVSADLATLCRESLTRNGLRDALIRIILTRGPGDEAVYPGPSQAPTLLVMPRPFQGYPQAKYEQGIKAVLVSVRRNSPQALPPRIKTINLLNNILAKKEAQERGGEEPIMLSADGHLAESCSANLFFASRGVVRTPDASVGLLWGITRRVVMDLVKKLGLPLEEGFYPPDELIHADEVFLTSTTKEILPVTLLDGKYVGHGLPGPISKSLLLGFRKHLSA